MSLQCYNQRGKEPLSRSVLIADAAVARLLGYAFYLCIYEPTSVEIDPADLSCFELKPLRQMGLRRPLCCTINE